MRIRFSRNVPSRLIAGVLIAAFAVRSLIPLGFMPSGEHPFAIAICPEGFPAQWLALAPHHHHGARHLHIDRCVFAAACASGPPSQSSALTVIPGSSLAPATPSAAETMRVRLVYLPHSRGPPAAA
jgi:hypothetical protein